MNFEQHIEFPLVKNEVTPIITRTNWENQCSNYTKPWSGVGVYVASVYWRGNLL